MTREDLKNQINLKIIDIWKNDNLSLNKQTDLVFKFLKSLTPQKILSDVYVVDFSKEAIKKELKKFWREKQGVQLQFDEEILNAISDYLIEKQVKNILNVK